MEADAPAVSTETQLNLEGVSQVDQVDPSGATQGEVEKKDVDTDKMDVSEKKETVDVKTEEEMEETKNGGNVMVEANEESEMGKKRLLEARAELQKPDSILEEDVFANIKAFFDAGGSPPEIIKSLSGSYRGFPQMVNLVSFWLRRAGVPDSEIVSLVEGHIRDQLLTKFDPQKADRIFQMGSAPYWLSDMITHAHWRHLIYKLSESHRDCLLLNYGIQQISEAGHDDEIAALPSASTYFSVFNRVLTNTIRKALKQTEWDLKASLSDFAAMCCHSEHTFLYTQSILRTISDSDPTGRLARISEELSGVNVKAQQSSSASSAAMDVDTSSHDPENLDKERQLFYITSLLYLTNISSFPSLASSILSVLKSTTPSPGDVRRIHSAYMQPTATASTTSAATTSDQTFCLPPTAYIRSPRLLDKIIAALFSTQQEVPSEFLSSYFWILAYASASTDARSTHPHVDIATYQNHATPTPANDPSILALADALQQVVTACKRTVVGMSIHNTSVTLFRHIHHPMVAIVALYWIRSCLCDAEKAPSSWGGKFLQAQFELLQEIAASHPLHHHQCLQIIIDLFSIESTMDPMTETDAKKKFAEFMVFLMEQGFVLPVLHTMEKLSSRIDKTFVRHFLVTLLEMAAPPFSTSFLDPVGQLALKVKIDASEHRSLVLQFVQHALKPGEYQLSSNTRDAFIRLQKTLVATV